VRNKSLILLIISILLSASLVSCAITPSEAPSEQPPASPTAELNLSASEEILAQTATATIVWFPATATPTPYPTPELDFTPTPEMRPGQGAIILQDDFSTSTNWSLNSTTDGRVALGKNELTIAIGLSTNKVFLYSLRQEPILSDFYLEITAQASICNSGDEYGLLIRAASPDDYYRFSLSCSSQARLDRVVGGQASSPQPWVLSGAVPPGSPGYARMAVWAKGREMRFFVNDEYLFTVSDPMMPSGMFGVFARGVNQSAVTINFSNLVIREIEP
jgi:hypothetical protein